MGFGPYTLLPAAILTVDVPSELPSALYLSILAEPVMFPVDEMENLTAQNVFWPVAFAVTKSNVSLVRAKFATVILGRGGIFVYVSPWTSVVIAAKHEAVANSFRKCLSDIVLIY